jgi:hypothetical protein
VMKTQGCPHYRDCKGWIELQSAKSRRPVICYQGCPQINRTEIGWEQGFQVACMDGPIFPRTLQIAKTRTTSALGLAICETGNYTGYPKSKVALHRGKSTCIQLL